MQDITDQVTTIAETIHGIRQNGKRLMIGLAGGPASGKSTLANELSRRLSLQKSGAIHVPAKCPVVIVEGNYLMFDEDPWRALAPLWDVSVRVAPPLEDLRARLIQRPVAPKATTFQTRCALAKRRCLATLRSSALIGMAAFRVSRYNRPICRATK